MNSLGQRAEIRDALQFVIRQLDMKMILDARQKIERLQAIDAQRLEKIIIGLELRSRHRKMLRRKNQNLLCCVL